MPENQENNINTNQFRKSENFPVASFLLPKNSAQPILALYEFARNADEIADNPTEDVKLRNQRLKNLYNAITSQNINKMPYYARDFFRSCKSGRMKINHGLALLEAFIQDTEKSRYDGFQDTLDYCQKSAATIGRMVLEASNEFSVETIHSDNICMVLQLINHLQDVKFDYLKNNRIYFHNIKPEFLIAEKETEEFTAIKLQIISDLESILFSAKPLLHQINSLRLRAEIGTIYKVAEMLLQKLRHENILSDTRVELASKQKRKALIWGIFSAIKNIHTKLNSSKKIAKAAKSSFVKPLSKLPKDKKKAMLCLYSFCRLVDDAVDDFTKTPENANINPLDFWRCELSKIYSADNVSYPQNPVCKELAIVVKKYNIPQEFLSEIIEGQQMDFNNLMNKPLDELLDKYCYRVASCVGLASVYIFGFTPQNKDAIHNFAINLGKGLQYINIIRDIREDAARGRIYLPLTLLQKYNLAEVTPQNLSNNFEKYEPQISEVLSELHASANNYFKLAYESLPDSEKHNMQTATLMLKVYKKYLDKMKDKNFIFTREEISLSFLEKLKLLMPYSI